MLLRVSVKGRPCGRRRRRSPAPPPLAVPAEKACPGREAQVVDENLFFYEEWELEATMDGALLARAR